MRLTLLVLLGCIASAQSAAAQLPRLAINDNRAPAGVLKDGVLTLNLEITKGMWHPDREADPGIDVLAIGEAGQPASVPGPLIRVPKGTIVRTTLKNTLDESFMVFGLHSSHGLADSVRVQAGETREFELRADQAGNYIYAAWRTFRVGTPENPPFGNDMATSSAFVVDEPNARANDRIFVINLMADTTRIPLLPGLAPRLVTLNGKSWPHTERISHHVGDTVHWRIINASVIPHPMHLHGFYFDVLSRGNHTADTIYAKPQERKAVTERMMPLTTMTMRWVPERAGNWLFHCHLPAHTALRSPLGPMKASTGRAHVHDAMQGMSNLMMGVTVSGPAPREAATRKRLRLVVAQKDSIAGEHGPRFSYTLGGQPNSKAAGPVIVVQQNQPTAITVVNRSREATAVHWHGIELESFNDGVAGFGGFGQRITPLIAAGDSFTARMTPPRPGTFIYHTHVDEIRQMSGGLYGALIVMPAGKSYDPVAEPTIVLGSATDSANILFNGERHPDLPLQVGKTYRLRMVHIMTIRPAMYVTLVDGAGTPAEWMLVAKDGADLPAHQKRLAPARQSMSNGETYDVLFTPPSAGVWRLETRGNNAPRAFSYMTLTAR